MSGGGDDSGLFGRGGVGPGRGEFPLDRDGELREVAVADDPAELPLGFGQVSTVAPTPPLRTTGSSAGRDCSSSTRPALCRARRPFLHRFFEASASHPVGGLASAGNGPSPRQAAARVRPVKACGDGPRQSVEQWLERQAPAPRTRASLWSSSPRTCSACTRGILSDRARGACHATGVRCVQRVRRGGRVRPASAWSSRSSAAGNHSTSGSACGSA
jgi:hypothetical protein